jgi:hypothetical protein
MGGWLTVARHCQQSPMKWVKGISYRPFGAVNSRRLRRRAKPLINPDAPTPSGYSYYLPYPDPRKEPVSYDDCQRKTSILFEFKGYYGGLLAFDSNARESFLSQSLRQIEASGGRPVVWIFADREDAVRTQKLFEDAGEGRQYITIVHVPWTTRGQ